MLTVRRTGSVHRNVPWASSTTSYCALSPTISFYDEDRYISLINKSIFSLSLSLDSSLRFSFEVVSEPLLTILSQSTLNKPPLTLSIIYIYDQKYQLNALSLSLSLFHSKQHDCNFCNLSAADDGGGNSALRQRERESP